jgi:chromosome transmission fidelity protein 4
MSCLNERYAHTEGHCCIRYTWDGKSVVTAGADGDVRVYAGINDSDSRSFLVGEEVRGMALSGSGRLFVAPSETNTVQAYTIEEGKSDGKITQFTADATCIDSLEDGSQVLAGSEDFTLKLINAESLKSKFFEGHTAPVLSVALDPKRDFVLSSSCDGSVRLWKIESESCVHTWSDCWAKSNDVSASVTSGIVTWHPQGGQIAIPMASGVKIYSADKDWAEAQHLKSSEEDIVTSVAFSPSGTYLVGGTNKSKLIVWRLTSGAIISESQSENGLAICGLAWNPKKQDEVAFITKKGYWGTVTGFLKTTDSSGGVAGKESYKPVNDNEMDPDELAAALLFDDDDDDDNENSFSIRRIKKETTGFLNNEDSNNTAAGDDEDDDDSKIATSVTPAPQVVQPQQQVVDIQEPFQPGSTPAHLESRFMVWNSVGIVRSFNSEDESSIDIEFHDTAVHYPIHLGNSHGYVMADLSTEAVLLANEADEAEAVASKLTCHHFASSDMSKEWSIDMPDKEDIMAICCGLGWVAAATDRRNLRIFSVGGMQREVIALPGPIVALSGYRNKIAVTVHMGMPLPGNQNIAIAVFSIGGETHDLPTFNPLPLAPRAFLSWLGFTDEGTPCIMDSAGFIRLLNRSYGYSWIQVCDSKALAKGKSDNWFMVGINEQEFSARCLLCKGTRYPPTIPRPVISVLSLKLPLCGLENNEKTGNEQSYWKSKIISRAIDNMNMNDDPGVVPIVSKEAMEQVENESLIKLFAHACQTEHESRAMDICKLMSSTALQLAIKYASKIRRMQLATKISNMACELQDAEEAAGELEAEKQKKQLEAMRGENRGQETYNRSQEASQDIFASQNDIDMEDEIPENPFLAADAKKESSSFLTKSSINTPTGENRNPFKKSTANPTTQSR